MPNELARKRYAARSSATPMDARLEWRDLRVTDKHVELLTRLEQKSAKIGIIGLGYVGLPLVLRYCEVGYNVIGFDVDHSKIELLHKGRSYIEHIRSEDLARFIGRNLEATTDFSRVAEVDALILCVPTPLSKHREPDLSFVLSTMDSVSPHLHAGMVLSLESTTYPGTTDEELKPRIEAQDLKVGEDIFLVYSPEREDPGNPNFSTQTIPKVCGGYTGKCLEAGIAPMGKWSTASFLSVRRARPNSRNFWKISTARLTSVSSTK